MRFLKKVFCAVALLSVAMLSTSASAEPKSGVEYQLLPTPQNTDAGKKVEVIEFFAYYCPHCNSFEPKLEAWIKKQGDNIVFKRVHVANGEQIAPQQRLFFTLEAMGLSEQYNLRVFQEMHVNHNRLESEKAVFDFVGQIGIDRAKFIEAYHSFGVSAKVRRGTAMMEAYGVDSWPMLIIDGRFRTSPSLAATTVKDAKSDADLHDATLVVMDYLVAKAKAEKK